MTDCLFCRIATRQVAVEGSPENAIILESDDFYVKPALGHFVEGYCLVIPKEHLRTMAELETEERFWQLERVIGELSRRLQHLYHNGICVFEHGAACPVHQAGACIDHAHLHVLPVNCDVRRRLIHFGEEKIARLSDLQRFEDERQSYIFYEPEPRERLVYLCNERVPSQLMRRLISDDLGINGEWDWRVSPHTTAIYSFLGKWGSSLPSKQFENMQCTTR